MANLPQSSICEVPYCSIPGDQQAIPHMFPMALHLKEPVEFDKDRLGLDKGHLCLSLYLLVSSK